MQPLGELVSVHPVNNARRWGLGIGALLVAGVPAGLLNLAIFNAWFVGFGQLMGYGLIVAVPALSIAVTQLAKAIRGGFGESYEIHQRGLVHVSWGVRRSWTWDQVYGVVTTGSEWGHRFGRDFGCVVSFHGGARVRFNGLTHNARTIAETLKNHCPEAVGREHGPRAGEIFEDILPWLTAVLAIALGWVTWWAVDHILTNEEQTAHLSPDDREAEALSDSALGGLTVLIFVSGLGALLSTVAAIFLLKSWFEDR
ncbi:hypothetical protein ACIBBB_04960 [Streptomyces sp. NPDC051217]|uniref:hypothetical protein n=1 Tax=Streptomyces sp. NPDC051217 TaxID=3365644 RepID=UPI0037941160